MERPSEAAGATSAMNEHALIVGRVLAAASGWVSGQALAAEAGVSRVSVRKYVQRLAEGGARVEARAGVGYRMTTLPGRPDELGIALRRKAATSAGAAGAAPLPALGSVIEHYPSVGSTNDAAIGRACSGAPEGLVVTSDVQTLGRGRRGRRWESPLGGLYLSVVLRPPVAPAELTKLGLLGALAACRALDDVGVAGASMKWPNDVMLEGQKIGGVLVEASADTERVDWAVLGVGIDVAHLPGVVGAVEGARAAGGARVGRAAVGAAFLDRLGELLAQLYVAGGDLLAALTARLETIGMEVRVVDAAGNSHEGRALGLAPDGSLFLATADGKVALSAGDVTTLRSR